MTINARDSYLHPDLEWLARNVSQWREEYSHACVLKDEEGAPQLVRLNNGQGYTKPEWLQARKYLGLDPSGISEADEEECIQLAYERMNDESAPTSIKQLRYQDAKGEDWIDEFARTASVDEFRGAMKFSIGKYNRRAGKKDDLIKEIEKMRDYCDRWIGYERSL